MPEKRKPETPLPLSDPQQWGPIVIGTVIGIGLIVLDVIWQCSH